MNERVIRKHHETIPGSSGKKRKLDNFKFAVGMGANWVDQDAGVLYMIQEYSEALHDPKIPKDKKLNKIRMVRLSDNKEIGWAEEWLVAEKMKDPEPDPKY